MGVLKGCGMEEGSMIGAIGANLDKFPSALSIPAAMTMINDYDSDQSYLRV